MNRLELIMELLKTTTSEDKYVKIAQGKYKKPTTIKEVIKHTRERNG